MSYSARVQAGVVTQVVVGDVAIVDELLPGVWVSVDGVRPGVGWTWDGFEFSAPTFSEVE